MAERVPLTRPGKPEVGPGWTQVETQTLEKGTRWIVPCTDWQAAGVLVVDLVLPFKFQEPAV